MGTPKNTEEEGQKVLQSGLALIQNRTARTALHLTIADRPTSSTRQLAFMEIGLVTFIDNLLDKMDKNHIAHCGLISQLEQITLSMSCLLLQEEISP